MDKLSHEFDPLTGVETITEHDHASNRFIVRHKGDITQNIEFAKAVQNDDEVWKTGVKRGWALIGHIPAITIVELRKIGIDVYSAPMKDIRAGLEKLGKPGFVWKS